MKSGQRNSKVGIITLFVLSLSAFVFLNTRQHHVCKLPQSISTPDSIQRKPCHEDPIQHSIQWFREFVKTLHIEPKQEKVKQDKRNLRLSDGKRWTANDRPTLH